MTAYGRALNSPMWPVVRSAAQLLAPGVAATPSRPLYQQVAIFKFFDFVAGIPDPDEVLLRTGRTRADLRALLRDAEVSQALDTRHDAVVATPWRLEAETESEQADFVTNEILPHLHCFVSDAWQAIPYGYAVLEVVYARRGGRIGIDQIHAPPFEWFRPLPDGSLRYFPIGGVGTSFGGMECDPRKFIKVARKPTYRNPYGEALLSPLYWPTTWRLQGWQLWLDFLDTFGTPIVVGKTSDYNAFVEAMRKQGVKRAVAWQPTGDKDELTTITASTAGEFERLEDALNRTIQKAVLGQTLTSDVGKTGSFAAAKVHNDVREDKRRADIRVISEAGQHLVDNLWMLNGFAGAAPKFVMQDDVGLERERADRDVVLSNIGVRFTPEYVAEQYGLEIDEDFKIVEPPAAPPPAPVGEVPRQNVKQTALFAAARRRFTPQQREVEDGVAAVLASAPQPITLEALRGAIAAARDEHDLGERLAVLLDKQDPAYPELLAYAQFAAQVLGYVHATKAPAAA